MVKIVFFGTPSFALPTLEALIQSPHQVVGVVTQPDRPAGRKQRASEPPVKALAARHGLAVLQPARLKERPFLAALADLHADLGVVAAYGRILPADVLRVPGLGFINVHASLLPKYRGAAPVQRAVIAGEPRTGVTIMRVVEELDAGPILAQAEREIGPEATSAEVARALADLGAVMLVRTIDDLLAGRIHERPQDPAEATDAPRLTKAEGIIDWTARAVDIHNLVRGLHPWPHAFTFLGTRRYLVLRTSIGPGQAESGQPGEIIQARGDGLVVAAGDREMIAITQIQPEGRRAMSAREFLAGHHVERGSRFSGEPHRKS